MWVLKKLNFRPTLLRNQTCLFKAQEPDLALIRTTVKQTDKLTQQMTYLGKRDKAHVYEQQTLAGGSSGWSQNSPDAAQVLPS